MVIICIYVMYTTSVWKFPCQIFNATALLKHNICLYNRLIEQGTEVDLTSLSMNRAWKRGGGPKVTGGVPRKMVQ